MAMTVPRSSGCTASTATAGRRSAAGRRRCRDGQHQSGEHRVRGEKADRGNPGAGGRGAEHQRPGEPPPSKTRDPSGAGHLGGVGDRDEQADDAGRLPAGSARTARRSQAAPRHAPAETTAQQPTSTPADADPLLRRPKAAGTTESGGGGSGRDETGAAKTAPTAIASTSRPEPSTPTSAAPVRSPDADDRFTTAMPFTAGRDRARRALRSRPEEGARDALQQVGDDERDDGSPTARRARWRAPAWTPRRRRMSSRGTGQPRAHPDPDSIWLTALSATRSPTSTPV